MGWLGWTEQQTLDTTIPAIWAAYRGKIEMLKACYGSSEKTPPKPMTFDQIRAALKR